MEYTYEYPRPAVTTDALILATHEGIEYILLIQRKYEPFKDFWALPGGFVNMDEELETACARELEEETGLKGVHLEQFGTFGAVDRDPRGRTINLETQVFEAAGPGKGTYVPKEGDQTLERRKRKPEGSK